MVEEIEQEKEDDVQEYDKVFSGVVGQTLAKERLMRSIKSVLRGGRGLCPLFTAPKGTGKTKIGHAYADAMQRALTEQYGSCNILKLHHYKSIRNSDSNEWKTFCTMIQSQEPWVLLMDECQDIHIKPTLQLDELYAFLRFALDKENQGKLLHIAGTDFVFDRRKNIVVAMTNFPEKFDKSGGAITSRFDVFELSTYTEQQTRAIFCAMMEEEGALVEPKAATMAARTGQGSVRVFKNLVDELVMTYPSCKKRPITLNQMISVLTYLKIWPRGFNEKQIKFLMRTIRKKDSNGRPLPAIIPRQYLAVFKEMSKEELDEAIASFGNPEIGFIRINGNGSVEITQEGINYLAKCQALGFTPPKM